MNIVAYLKPVCGWSDGVREVFKRYNLDYEEKLISDTNIYAEMVMKSGQPLQPCVEVDGEMLEDIDGKELEDHLLRADNDICATRGNP